MMIFRQVRIISRSFERVAQGVDRRLRLFQQDALSVEALQGGEMRKVRTSSWRSSVATIPRV